METGTMLSKISKVKKKKRVPPIKRSDNGQIVAVKRKKPTSDAPKKKVFNYNSREKRNSRKRKNKDKIGPAIKAWVADPKAPKICGIDMSLRNPGLCCMEKGKISLYFFRNRKTLDTEKTTIVLPDDHPWFPGYQVVTECLGDLDRKNYPGMLRFQRYKMADVMASKVTGGLVCIEQYIFPKPRLLGGRSFHSKSNEDTIRKLIEVGTCLRKKLLETVKPENFVTVRPSNAKKEFTLDGSADKDYMYWVFRNDFAMPDIVSMVRPKLSEKSYENGIPNPFDDMVDAFALALCNLIKTE